MFDNKNALNVAERFTKALASQDTRALKDLYADDVVIWHNTTNANQSKEENISLMKNIFDLLSEFGYHDITRLPTPEGFVQYHKVQLIFKDGTPVGDAYACMVVTVKNDKITAIHEFLDASQQKKLWERLGQGSLSR
jgi:ketosteroid isomerase-like protein